MPRKKQYYVVVHGQRPGIYREWFGHDGAADQIDGFPGAIYKGFYTHEEAMAWLRDFDREALASHAPGLLELLESHLESTPADSVEDLLDSGKILIYTDGGAIENPGPGGYGVVLRYKGQRRELSGGSPWTTNNRMELLACIKGLRALKRKCQVILYSDSRYVVDGMSKGWADRWQTNGWKLADGEDAKNADLWQELLELSQQHEIEFRWVKGHAGNSDNERCDRLAVTAARRMRKEEGPGET